MAEEAVDDIVKLLQITDLHILPSAQDTLAGVNTELCYQRVIAAAQRRDWPPHVILFTGDLAQEPSRPTYRRLLQWFRRLGPVCVCLPGNHDDPALMAEVFNGENIAYTGEIVTVGWQIICLDSKLPGEEGGHLAESELERLETCLGRHPERHALVTLHHHVIPSGSKWLDEMIVDNAADFLEIIGRHRQARTVLCGHIHQHFDETRHGIRFLGTPSTCFQFKPYSKHFALDSTPPGYRWLHLHPDGSIATGVIRLSHLPVGLDLATAGY